MFTCCDTELATNGFKQCLDLHETAYTLDILLYILHTLPQIPGSSSADYAPIYTGFPNQVIPFPLLFRLSDKYVLPVAFVNDLRFRLAAYALTCPLRAYGYAVELGMDEIAAEASSHLLSPPLATYTLEDISVIPKVAAYHALLSLHEFRARKLREVLMDEPLFPYGYGECPKHGQKTNLQWEQWKVDLLPKVHAGAYFHISATQQPVNSTFHRHEHRRWNDESQGEIWSMRHVSNSMHKSGLYDQGIYFRATRQLVPKAVATVQMWQDNQEGQRTACIIHILHPHIHLLCHSNVRNVSQWLESR